MLNRTFARFALLLFLLALNGCGKEPLYQQESFVFGTQVEVSIYGETDAKARAAVAAVLQEFDRLHREFHAWKPGPLMALNAAIARGERHQVSAELAAAIRDATQLSEASDGLFNPAIGQLIALWGFQNDEFKPLQPDPEKIAALVRAQPRMRDLTVDVDNFVSSKNPTVQLDFGGYAKGLALDNAVRILRAQGVAHALVNIGGNIIALGKHGARPWHVGVKHPRTPSALIELDLNDGEAIGTSGDYQRYFELNGQRYCHIIDPRTGYPATHTQSLTVLAAPGPRAGVLSDAASKPGFIADIREWEAALKRLGIEAAIRVDESGKIAMSEAMARRAKRVRD
ncbi:MAG: FAD:protein FMN transferase [Burkholderiales bacterium]|nr:FAD:protein FMN transferase [Burkholderiales bacterium]